MGAFTDIKRALRIAGITARLSWVVDHLPDQEWESGALIAAIGDWQNAQHNRLTTEIAVRKRARRERWGRR